MRALQRVRAPKAERGAGTSVREHGAPSSAGLRLTAFLALGGLLLAPLPSSAQTPGSRTFETAELPPGGTVVLRVAPRIDRWRESYGTDGVRRLLSADVEGPIADRIFPGSGALAESLNEDAAALGFDPLEEEQVSLGALNFRELAAETRTIPFALEAGILDWLAVDVSAPVVLADVESFFAYDSAGATLVPAAAAVESPASFFGEIGSARADLQEAIESGELAPDERAAAEALLESSGTFAAALQRRVMQNALLPLGGTPAGEQILARYGGLAAGFADFGLSLPGLGLPETATSTDAGSLLGGGLLGEGSLGGGRRVRLGDLEAGLRLQLLNTFDPDPPADGDRPAAGDEASGGDRDPDGLRFRTALGVRARLPLGSPDEGPRRLTDEFLGLPATRGNGGIELSLYQDVRYASFLRLDAVLRYGIERPDRFRTRIRAPDRPFGLPATERLVERDSGDRTQLRIAPGVILDRALSVGLEYAYWRREPDRYRVVGGREPDPTGDASPLELETLQERHRLGLGLRYRVRGGPEGDTTDGGESEGDRGGDGPRETPWELGLLYQLPISGSGGQTPVARRLGLHLRIPVRLF